MLPVLLDLKFVKVYTFGVFLVLAFFWGSFILWRNVRLTSYKEEDIFDMMFVAVGGSIFLSRLVYVVLNFDKFGFNFLKFILINGYPGLSLYGGLLGGFISLYIYSLFKKIDFALIVDYFITPVLIVLTFGKIGSFFSGSEVGTKTNFLLAIKYSGYDGLRHLTPFYEGILFGLGAMLSYKLIFDVRKEKYPNGFVFNFFCFYFALVYILFDKLKANPIYLIPFKTQKEGYSFNFITSAVLLLIFAIYNLYYFRNSILNYGKPAYKKITKRFAGAVGSGGKKSSKTNR